MTRCEYYFTGHVLILPHHVRYNGFRDSATERRTYDFKECPVRFNLLLTGVAMLYAVAMPVSKAHPRLTREQGIVFYVFQK